MDVAAWGALGEMVGAFAVVISVIYLAGQVRDSSKVARVQAHQLQSQAAQLLQRMEIDHPGPWRRGLAAPESLSPDELSQFHSLLYSHLLHCGDVWHAGRNGVFDQATHDAWLNVMASLTNSAGGAAWWAESRSLFVPELVDDLEKARKVVPPWTAIHPGQYRDLLEDVE